MAGVPNSQVTLLLQTAGSPEGESVQGPLYITGSVSVANLVFQKTSGLGIQVDTTTPTFGWRDILGDVSVKAGANDPTITTFRGNIKAFVFGNSQMNETFNNFHMPHDYVAGSDIFVHVHWSQNVVDTGGAAASPGVAKWYFDVSYAKGHRQAAFIAPITTSVTQTASAIQYQHMLAEIQLSATLPTASQLDSTLLEPDGVVIVRTYRDAADVADTLNQVPFVFYVDIHYQSTNIATKQKAPNFYT